MLLQDYHPEAYKRKRTAPIFCSRLTGKFSGTLESLAKEEAISSYDCSSVTGTTVLKRMYFSYKKLIAKLTPKSIHYKRRESKISETINYPIAASCGVLHPKRNKFK